MPLLLAAMVIAHTGHYATWQLSPGRHANEAAPQHPARQVGSAHAWPAPASQPRAVTAVHQLGRKEIPRRFDSEEARNHTARVRTAQPAAEGGRLLALYLMDDAGAADDGPRVHLLPA